MPLKTKTQKIFLMYLFVFISVSNLACRRENLAPKSALLVNGFAVGPTGRPETVAIVKGGKLVCTGVMVAPQIVLTASRCISEVTEKQELRLKDLRGYGVHLDGPNSDQQLTPQYQVLSGGYYDSKSQATISQKTLNEVPSHGYLVIDREVPVSKIAIPLSIEDVPNKYDTVEKKFVSDQDVLLVGFGATDCLKNDYGYKRELYTTEWARAAPPIDKFLVNVSESVMLCGGDLGSGVFMPVKGGGYRLLGILSDSLQLNDLNVAVYEPFLKDAYKTAQFLSPNASHGCNPFPLAPQVKPKKPEIGPLDSSDRMCPLPGAHNASKIPLKIRKLCNMTPQVFKSPTKAPTPSTKMTL